MIRNYHQISTYVDACLELIRKIAPNMFIPAINLIAKVEIRLEPGKNPRPGRLEVIRALQL
jgi:hypothetical protein